MYSFTVSRNEWLQWLKTSLARLPFNSEGGLAGFVTPLVEISSSHELTCRLDWLVHAGGITRARLDLRRSRDLVIAMSPDPVLSFEIQTWLDLHAAVFGRAAYMTTREARGAWEDVVPALRGREWREVSETHRSESELFETFQLDSATRTNFLRALHAADVDLEEPPWLLWSRLPGWLRGQTDHAELVWLETRLAFLRCALSPQDERSEAASLGTGGVMVNPTFETVRGKTLIAFARRYDEVVHRDLSELEAAILDHVREAFRADRTKAIQDLSGETGVRREFIAATLEGLILDGFLLGQVERANAETLQ